MILFQLDIYHLKRCKSSVSTPAYAHTARNRKRVLVIGIHHPQLRRRIGAKAAPVHIIPAKAPILEARLVKCIIAIEIRWGNGNATKCRQVVGQLPV